MGLQVLSINCGSSSLKYALFDVDESGERAIDRGAVERIGAGVPNHAAAVHATLQALADKGIARPDVVGHRIVHGGPGRTAPALVDDALLESLRALVPFAPLHLPAEIGAVEAVSSAWPGLPQVACFDTAFHRTLPEVAQRYALDERLHEGGVRKYGFHGLSYEYVVAKVGADKLGRAVLAHLGSGASMVAVRDGRAVDTTMGFTPSGGLVMATRPGDVDPGLIVYLVREGYDARKLDELVNRAGGMVALGGTADMRELLARRDAEPRAALAVDVFVWSARKWVGAMSAALGGIDTLVFSGGIGEHAPKVRWAITLGLQHLGVCLDEARNARGEAVISVDGAPCTVRVVPTDEEQMVARHARRVATHRSVTDGPR